MRRKAPQDRRFNSAPEAKVWAEVHELEIGYTWRTGEWDGSHYVEVPTEGATNYWHRVTE